MWLKLVVLIIDRGATCTKRDLPPVANLKPDLVSRLTYLSVSVALSYNPHLYSAAMPVVSYSSSRYCGEGYFAVPNAHKGGVQHLIGCPSNPSSGQRRTRGSWGLPWTHSVLLSL